MCRGSPPPPLSFGASSLSKAPHTSTLVAPWSVHLTRRRARSRIDDDGETQGHHHYMLPILFLLFPVGVFLMWSLNTSCLGLVKRVLEGPRRLRNPHPVPVLSTVVPSPTHGVEGELGAMWQPRQRAL